MRVHVQPSLWVVESSDPLQGLEGPSKEVSLSERFDQASATVASFAVPTSTYKSVVHRMMSTHFKLLMSFTAKEDLIRLSDLARQIGELEFAPENRGDPSPTLDFDALSNCIRRFQQRAFQTLERPLFGQLS